MSLNFHCNPLLHYNKYERFSVEYKNKNSRYFTFVHYKQQAIGIRCVRGIQVCNTLRKEVKISYTQIKSSNTSTQEKLIHGFN